MKSSLCVCSPAFLRRRTACLGAGWVCAAGGTGEGAWSDAGWHGQCRHLRFSSARISAPAQGTSGERCCPQGQPRALRGPRARNTRGSHRQGTGQTCHAPGKESRGCFPSTAFQMQQLYQECLGCFWDGDFLISLDLENFWCFSVSL